MEHLEINHETMVAAEVDMVFGANSERGYRVMLRDLDTDRTVSSRTFKQRDVAIAYAQHLVAKVAA